MIFAYYGYYVQPWMIADDFDLQHDDGVMNYVLVYGDFEKRSKARVSVRKLEKGLRRGNVKARKFRYPQKELADAQY